VRLLVEIEAVQNATATPILCPGRLESLRLETSYIAKLWEQDLKGYADRTAAMLRRFPPLPAPTKEELEDERRERRAMLPPRNSSSSSSSSLVPVPAGGGGGELAMNGLREVPWHPSPQLAVGN
jgi:hypothetical protein